MSQHPRPARLPSLTSLRFVLAMAVTACHLALISGIFGAGLDSPLGVMEPLATSAVSGFFVLSGYVLTWAHVPGESRRAFWRRRFWKLVPNHVLGWTSAIVFFWVVTAAPPTMMPDGHGPVAAVAGLLLVQSWVPDADVFFSFNTPAWSISCEAFFYAVFPALLAAVLRIPAHRLRTYWAALAACTLLLPLASTFVPGPQLYDWLPVNETSLWFSYLCPPVRLAEFALGVLTARLVRTGRWPRLRRVQVAAPAVVVCSAIPLLPPQYAFGMPMAAPLALVVAALSLADLEGRTRWMRHPRFVLLGEASFALYLTHYPLMLVCRHLMGVERTFGVLSGLLVVTAQTVASLALALAVHRCYESPLMRRWARPRVRPTAETHGTVPGQTVPGRTVPGRAVPRERRSARRSGASSS